MTVRILTGDCRDHLSQIDASSIDSIVTDPPYGLSFMGKGWDHGVPGVEFWTEALRVLKPGGHLLAFGGTRTHHRLMVAIEDAGFEIRDCLMWLYGSGFPKSLDVSKAIDKAAGAEREAGVPGPFSTRRPRAEVPSVNAYHDGVGNAATALVTAPVTDLAKQWDGWGTALKPAWEPIILARKPLIGSVAANVTAYGAGALNVDGCRIEGKPEPTRFDPARHSHDGWRMNATGAECAVNAHPAGRWPANVVLDEDAAALLDAQSGERKAGSAKTGLEPKAAAFSGNLYGDAAVNGQAFEGYGDTGGASRFFYVAKASSAERNRGLSGLPERRVDPVNHTDQRVWDIPGSHATPRANHHPTVKPIALMQWLCRLVTPAGGTVLDPFMGSGSTLIAASREGFNAVGIELDPEYAEIARRRITGDCPLFVEVA